MSGGSQYRAADSLPIVHLESDHLKTDVAPTVGGRILSLVEKSSGYDFLWRNQALPLCALPSGSEYDPNFYGGIDELLPNDMPENIDGIDCPDHGELWTTPLSWRKDGERLILEGHLAKSGLTYHREMSLRSDSPCVDFKYRISNPMSHPRHFLWKLHAALAVQPGDVIDCPARRAQVVDRAWSRYKTLTPFDWPRIDGSPVNVVPAPDGTMDFFYLFDLADGEITWRRPGQNLRFTYKFDRKVFPFTWIFASYGGFNGHYTVILEPCTAMPISVNDAASKKQCTQLQPGQTLETSVAIHVGLATNSV